jgi:hypothetical protein
VTLYHNLPKMRGRRLTIEYLSATVGAMLLSPPTQSYAVAAQAMIRLTASVGVVLVEVDS